ncbi:alpha/beta hydrolase fold family protein [Burkholderia thailandensis 34]|uniref:alpha/beta hydrolase n=1 Tax=Burkholderia thailandensis TaxID=57975 RepID=UPI0005DA42C2|nr:alpha/beta hydrolase [Burkholderia thailandensis]AJY31289.1 alpha/beta hydrolase fold family protein [Burkholderia thailandensis 34]AOJ60251.1 alpha/beta hydrolase [Burkholderia thailandensis]KXF59616.1 alpha/beta hydrolase [Burkholderia thailandensis]PNE78028.1 alpha/beta hydrolase [Burkholderia thailandensis]
MLEPAIEAFVARVAAWYPDDAAARPIVEQRALYERFAAAWTPALPADVDTCDARIVAADGREIRLRRYRSRRSASRGTVLFFHGGGFVVGSLDSHALLTARIAADTGLDVIAVDYRLAPEHRAPAAFDDCLEAAVAALDGRLPFESIALPLRLAGDSAGGTLAASVAAALRDGGRGGHGDGRETRGGVRAVALVYPMLGFEPQLPARDTRANAPMLTLADVRAYRRLYWGDAGPPPGALPLDAPRFDGLPPVLAIGAEHDPLCDDARVYVERIRSAGGAARFWRGDGLVHGCWRALDTSAQAARMHRIVCAFLLAPGG